MEKFVIEGGRKLSGNIYPQGAKNEALQVICAVILTKEAVTISNIPEILDVMNLIHLLEDAGVTVTRHAKGKYTFQADKMDINTLDMEAMLSKCAKLRGSVMVVGPVLARFGHAYFPNQEETKSEEEE